MAAAGKSVEPQRPISQHEIHVQPRGQPLIRESCMSLTIRLILLICLCGVLESASAGIDSLDSLLAVQRERAGTRADLLFAPLEPSGALDLSAEGRSDYRFLLANLPLSDLAALDSSALLANVRLARRARGEFSWGASVPEELWHHYVLPHRVSQEPWVPWRARFLEELAPRVAGLSMGEAALEVNHWCHEMATYQPSDGRDQDPLTTIRAGLGRCEEEMILAIAALRSVGIPARQCYTPYWAHMDDNHAWVEVWTEGAWSWLGACEPAPALGQAWFTDPAQRAMLVVSQAYGAVAPGGVEPVLKKEGRSTAVNSTAVYGPVKTLGLSVTDARGRPLARRRVVFQLFNYGGWMPALAQETDARGRLELACGRGSWLVTAGDGKRAGLLHVDAGTTEATLVLDRPEHLALPELVEYAPPPPAPASRSSQGLVFAEGLARGLVDTAAVRQADQLFQRRLQREDSLREADLWGRWRPREAWILEATGPDSLRLLPLLERAEALGTGRAELLRVLRAARGNWGTLELFLLEPEELKLRLELLGACSDKDLREISGETLRDHLDALATLPGPLVSDSLALARWREHVLPTRLDHEPGLPWRGALRDFLERHEDLWSSRNDHALLRWLRRELRVDSDRDRLGAPLTPAQVLALGGGSRGDITRLYLGLCRARGIPACTGELTGRLERWEEGAWRPVELFRAKGSAQAATGRLTILAADSLAGRATVFKDWCLMRWEGDRLEAVELGWHEPLSALTMPLELPVGRYCLSSGRRREDGSARVRLEWVTVAKGRDAAATLVCEP